MALDYLPLQNMEDLPSSGLVGANGYPLVQRSNKYGEIFHNQLGIDRLVDEGSLFRVRNATVATGIAQTQNTTQDTAKPFIMGRNPTTSLRTIRIHRLYLRATAIASGQTVQYVDVVVDTGGLRASAGTDYNIRVTGLNASVGYNDLKGGAAVLSAMDQLFVGVPVYTPGTNQKLVAHIKPRTTTIPVVGDEYVMNFGSMFAGAAGTAVTPVGTTVDTFVSQHPLVVVPPGCSFEIIPWAASVGSAMSWEFDMIWSER